MGPSALCKNETLSRIGAVDAQKRSFFPILVRATLCGDRASWIALTMAPCESSRFAYDPLIALAVVPCESSRSARDRLQGSSCTVATFRYKSSTRSASPQLRLQSRNFQASPQLRLQSRKVGSEMHRGMQKQMHGDMRRGMHRASPE